jgi:hypothetical protein
MDLLPDCNQFSKFPRLLDYISYLSAAGLSLLAQLLLYDYKRRLTTLEGLELEYFREVPLPSDECSMPKCPLKYNHET